MTVAIYGRKLAVCPVCLTKAHSNPSKTSKRPRAIEVTNLAVAYAEDATQGPLFSTYFIVNISSSALDN